MSNAYSGVEANVYNGGSDVDAQDWNADIETNTFDSTTTADLGWDDETPATSKVSGTFHILWNPSKSPGSLGITRGAQVAMILYVNKGDDVKLSGQGLIKKIAIKGVVKAGIDIVVTFTNKGPWTLPS